jgi:nicotinate-nucleotide--dimethylbenzimidazole phosphoribosyltransferase
MSVLQRTLNQIAPLDREMMAQARARQDTLTKPRGSLGRLEDLSVQVAGITGQLTPPLDRKAVLVLAGDHGVTQEGVSAYPPAVTPQMIQNFLRGGAAINVLARQVGARVVVVDVGVAFDFEPHPDLLDFKVAHGTRNLAVEPAMTREQAILSIEAGIRALENEMNRGLNLVATGDMGIGNTTPASAITAAITGLPVPRVTGRGTGLNDEQLTAKVATIERALAINRPDARDPLDVLSKVGGLEIGGIAGVVLGAAAHRIPVIIDGFISGAGALIAAALCPEMRGYMLAAHNSVEIGHRAILSHLAIEPLLDLSMRLGEGTGAALAMHLVEASVRILREMATFASAGVADKERPA